MYGFTVLTNKKKMCVDLFWGQTRVQPNSGTRNNAGKILLVFKISGECCFFYYFGLDLRKRKAMKGILPKTKDG